MLTTTLLVLQLSLSAADAPYAEAAVSTSSVSLSTTRRSLAPAFTTMGAGHIVALPGIVMVMLEATFVILAGGDFSDMSPEAAGVMIGSLALGTALLAGGSFLLAKLVEHNAAVDEHVESLRPAPESPYVE